MNDCQRGCCWTGLLICAREYKCRCHQMSFHEWIGAPIRDHSRTDYPDPTADQAVRNIMRGRANK